jgi:nucleolar protein 56
MIKSVKKDIKEEYTETDLHITKSINLIDALDETINLLTEHLREWHAIHFPELNQLIKSNEEFVKLVQELLERKNFTEKNIFQIIKDNELSEKIAFKAMNSSGQDTDLNTLNEMKSLSEKILSLKKERIQLTEFVEKEMNKKWPNYSNKCGAIIGARILAKIGSGKKLAFAPSSTIQVIGAEKALFEALKKREKTPKHGYLFAHPLVQQASKKDKGKIARKIAGKISIAIKQDYFSKTHKAIEKPKTQKEIRKEEFNKRNQFSEKKYQSGNLKISIKQKGFERKNFKEKNFKRKIFENERKPFKRKFEKENEFRNKFKERKPFRYRNEFEDNGFQKNRNEKKFKENTFNERKPFNKFREKNDFKRNDFKGIKEKSNYRENTGFKKNPSFSENTGFNSNKFNRKPRTENKFKSKSEKNKFRSKPRFGSSPRKKFKKKR